MSRFIKVVSNEIIKIEEYKNPRVCFNNTEYDDIENYCVLRETINPFQMLYKNKELQQRIDKAISIMKNDLSRVTIQRMIDNENIKVNGKRTKASYKFNKGDELYIIAEEIKETKLEAQDIPLDIIDEQILTIDDFLDDFEI